VGKRLLVGLIGANVQGSLSPALHEDACAAAGIVGHYQLMDLDRLPGRRLPDLMTAARMAGFAGLNITFPCKETVIGLLDEVTPEARQIGAVNTVTFDRDGRATGHNTDRIGFRRSFEETLGRAAVESRTALLVGAGGAGRALAFALLDLGAECVLVHDQDGARAAGLVASVTAQFERPCARVAPDPRAALKQAAGVVNATPVGMLGFPGNPVPMDAVEARHWAVDVIYTPLESELLKAARAKGAAVLNGGGMCIHQAVEAFRLWTGLVPDLARMRRTFLAAASARDAELSSSAAIAPE
jgi:quinate/shikimate dehydrogenase (NAD+)